MVAGKDMRKEFNVKRALGMGMPNLLVANRDGFELKNAKRFHPPLSFGEGLAH